MKYLLVLFSVFLLQACDNDMNQSNLPPTPEIVITPTPVPVTENITNSLPELRYLALGDSYTFGESVCDACKFPMQLDKKLESYFTENTITTKIIAKTGWTTNNLITEIAAAKLPNNFDLVTLLIGVNNQYQKQSFAIYEKEFPALVKRAIELVKGNKKRLLVVSIPDYAFTPFGSKSEKKEIISQEIANYNTFAKNYCLEKNIVFINITDITQEGLQTPDLVATDGLHPSSKAYTKFVERILPLAKTALSE